MILSILLFALSLYLLKKLLILAILATVITGIVRKIRSKNEIVPIGIFSHIQAVMHESAVAIDTACAVVFQDLLNFLMLTKNRHTVWFSGQGTRSKMTISGVLAVNYYLDTLSLFGDIIVSILEFIDPGHMAEAKEKNEQYV